MQSCIPSGDQGDTWWPADYTGPLFSWKGQLSQEQTLIPGMWLPFSWLQGLNNTILWGLKYHLVYTHGISQSFTSDQKTLFVAQKVGERAHEPGAHWSHYIPHQPRSCWIGQVLEWPIKMELKLQYGGNTLQWWCFPQDIMVYAFNQTT